MPRYFQFSLIFFQILLYEYFIYFVNAFFPLKFSKLFLLLLGDVVLRNNRKFQRIDIESRFLRHKITPFSPPIVKPSGNIHFGATCLDFEQLTKPDMLLNS